MSKKSNPYKGIKTVQYKDLNHDEQGYIVHRNAVQHLPKIRVRIPNSKGKMGYAIGRKDRAGNIYLSDGRLNYSEAGRLKRNRNSRRK